MEKVKTLFDVIGPVIIGPSSSHTAGAVRIGLLARKIFGEIPQKVKFKLYNSFAKTGKGHGTDKGLLGGVLGMDVDNDSIKKAYDIAKKLNVHYEFEYLEDYNRHPNSVDVILEGKTVKKMEISGISVGAGEVAITKINGYKFNINGDYDTLVLFTRTSQAWFIELLHCCRDRTLTSLPCIVIETPKVRRRQWVFVWTGILLTILCKSWQKSKAFI